MKNRPDELKDHVRRTFTKSLVAVLVTAPLTSSLVSAEKLIALARRFEPPNPQFAFAPLNLMLSHLPPILISSDSFELESRVELSRNSVSGKRPYRYTQNEHDPDVADPQKDLYGNINRVRVTDDYGKVHYDVTSSAQWKIEIYLQQVLNEKKEPVYQSLENIPEEQIVLIQGGPFELFIGEKFDTGSGGEKKYKGEKRHKKYKREKFDDKRVRIGKIKVAVGTSITEITEAPEKGYRIGITFDDNVRALTHLTGQLRCARLKR